MLNFSKSFFLMFVLCASFCVDSSLAKGALGPTERDFLNQIKLVKKLADDIRDTHLSARKTKKDKWHKACVHLIDLFRQTPAFPKELNGDDYALIHFDLVREVIDENLFANKTDKGPIDQSDFSVLERFCETAAKRSSKLEFPEVFIDCLDGSTQVLFRRGSFQQAEELLEKCRDHTVIGSNERLHCFDLIADGKEKAGHLNEALMIRQTALNELLTNSGAVSEQALLARVQLARTLAICGKKNECLNAWHIATATVNQLSNQAELSQLVTGMANLAYTCANTGMFEESRPIFLYTLKLAQKGGIAYYVGHEGECLHSALLDAGRYPELEQLLNDEIAFYRAHMANTDLGAYAEDLAALAQCFEEHFYSTLGEPRAVRLKFLQASKEAYKRAFAAATKNGDFATTPWQERKQAFNSLPAVF